MNFDDDVGGHFFETYGPYSLPKNPEGELCRPLATWWDEVDEVAKCEVSRAIGCYMFVMGDRNIKPWYVGKTVNRNGFREETFTSHKLNHYNEVIGEGYRGPPGLYLFPKITLSFVEDWRFCFGRSHSAAIEWLERTLIGMAYSQNQELMNSRDVTFLRTVHVRGLLGKRPRGPRRGDISKARQALLGDKSHVD